MKSFSHHQQSSSVRFRGNYFPALRGESVIFQTKVRHRKSLYYNPFFANLEQFPKPSRHLQSIEIIASKPFCGSSSPSVNFLQLRANRHCTADIKHRKFLCKLGNTLISSDFLYQQGQPLHRISNHINLNFARSFRHYNRAFFLLADAYAINFQNSLMMRR